MMLSIFGGLCQASTAQKQSAPLTVTAATQNAALLGSSQVLVRGRLWLGKEGSMIYDSGYKATLPLRYSDAFNAKHSFHELIGKVRTSETVTIIGRLQRDSKGRLTLVAEDIFFAGESK